MEDSKQQLDDEDPANTDAAAYMISEDIAEIVCAFGIPYVMIQFVQSLYIDNPLIIGGFVVLTLLLMGVSAVAVKKFFEYLRTRKA